MEEVKTDSKLLSSLKTAILALENDTIEYKWKTPSTCNCGVVFQSILGITKDNLRDRSEKEVTEKLGMVPDGQRTWKAAIKQLCSVTGETNVKIFQELFKLGMSPEDISHLEYLENPAILNKVDLKKSITKIARQKTGEVKKTIPVSRTIKKGWFLHEVVIKDEVSVEETFENVTTTTSEFEKDYYTNKDSLIKYLKGWVQILEEPHIDVSEENITRLQLQEELLRSKSIGDIDKCNFIKSRLASML